jgi:hypothetical protein
MMVSATQPVNADQLVLAVLVQHRWSFKAPARHALYMLAAGAAKIGLLFRLSNDVREIQEF